MKTRIITLKNMKLSLYTICVNESEILKQTLKYNNKIFDQIYVITTLEDQKTTGICGKYDKVIVETTDDFLEKNIVNKAKALNILLENASENEWIVIAENNYIFPENIKYELERITNNSMQDDVFSFCRSFVDIDELNNLSECKVTFEKNIEHCQIFNQSSKFLNFIYHESNYSNYCNIIFSNQWPKKNKHLLNGIIYCLNKIENKIDPIKTKWINEKLDYADIDINNYSTIPAYCIIDHENVDNLLFAEKEFEILKWPSVRKNLTQYYKSPHYRLSSYEASYLDAHKNIWEEIINKNYPFGAIFEDSVIFTSDFNINFPTFVKDLPEDWDVWHLHATKAKDRKCHAHIPIKDYLVKINSPMWGSHGYLVSNQGCKKLLELPDNVPVNLRLSNFHSSELNIYGIRTSYALVFCKGNKEEDNIEKNEFWQNQFKKFYR